MTKQVEVIASVQRRRRWPRAEKERIVAAAMEPAQSHRMWRGPRVSAWQSPERQMPNRGGSRTTGPLRLRRHGNAYGQRAMVEPHSAAKQGRV